jgi:hypothetical protein
LFEDVLRRESEDLKQEYSTVEVSTQDDAPEKDAPEDDAPENDAPENDAPMDDAAGDVSAEEARQYAARFTAFWYFCFPPRTEGQANPSRLERTRRQAREVGRRAAALEVLEILQALVPSLDVAQLLELEGFLNYSLLRGTDHFLEDARDFTGRLREWVREESSRLSGMTERSESGDNSVRHFYWPGSESAASGVVPVYIAWIGSAFAYGSVQQT